MDAVVQRVRKTLKRGRSVELPPDDDEAHYVLLPYCMQNQHRALGDLLTGSTYDINYQGGRISRTLLHYAANLGGWETMQLLLKKGAGVNIQDRNGMTPLHLAARSGRSKCIQRLMDAGADIRLCDHEGLTALHWLALNGRTELLLLMLQKGEFIDAEDVYGQTALHSACRNGHHQTVRELLQHHADINKADHQGRLPLNFACQNGQAKCVELLLNNGAKCATDSKGISPIQQCVTSGFAVCAELILNHFPSELERMIGIVCTNEDINEQKAINTLHHLCCCGQHYHSVILRSLAQEASTTGLELLSSSSDYGKWSTQFLRIVSILCMLDDKYWNTVSSPHKQEMEALASPRRRRWNSFLSSREHPPTSSIDLGAPRNDRHSISGPDSSRADLTDSDDISNSPFFLLSDVWSSLHSWYDLLEQEVQQLPGAAKHDKDKNPAITVSQASRQNSTSKNSLEEESSAESSKLSVVPLRSISVDSGSADIAAAIVKGAPSCRREAFLRGKFVKTLSMEELPRSKDSAQAKRRSLNLDNPAVALSPELLSLQQQPTANVGGAANVQISVAAVNETVPVTRASPIEEGNEEDSPPPNVLEDTDAADNIMLGDDKKYVSDFVDRLCAITNGYAMCCANLHKKTDSTEEVYPPLKDFIDKYEMVLKVLLARKPLLIFEHFHFLLDYPSLMKEFMHIIQEQPFDVRKKWFFDNLYKDKRPNTDISLLQANVMMVDRGNIFSSSCSKIMEANPDNLKENLSVRFDGEAGMGTGVVREWFNELSAEVLNPNYALFIQSANGATFQPNSNSAVNPDHLSYFHFSGRMMGLAIYHQQLLSVYFTRSFYKHILGVPVNYQDVESIDPAFAKNLQWTLDNQIDDMGLDLTFAMEVDVFGTPTEKELFEGGKDVTVCDQNKHRYVQLVAEMKLTSAIKAQISHFLDGFYSIIPRSLIALFNECELELLMSGLPEIDADDWEANTEYSGGENCYTQDSQAIKWFWELVHEYSQEDKALLLQFVTGSSRVPMGGFTNLVGASGLQKFTISKERCSNRLPTASTCFNLLKLPEYGSKTIMAERISVAIHCGSQRFEFA